MKRLMLAALAAVSLLAFSASACGGKGGMGGPNFAMMDALWSLELSADQESKLDAIVRDHRKALIDLEAMNPAAAMEAFGKDKFDRKAFIKAKQAPIEARIKACADFHEKIHGVLTPAQREAFSAAVSSCGEKRGSCGPKGEQRGKKCN
ncbi:MAG: periplasmic heavy metal sensor [Campylobacterales bacterium]